MYRQTARQRHGIARSCKGGGKQLRVCRVGTAVRVRKTKLCAGGPLCRQELRRLAQDALDDRVPAILQLLLTPAVLR